MWLAFRLAAQVLTDIALRLTQFGIVCLVIAIAAGWRWPRSNFWKWADPIYYLLSMIGLILLFISNEPQVSLGELRLKLDEVKNDVRQHDSMPPPRIGELGSYFLSTAYNGLHAEEELGKACQEAGSLGDRCTEAKHDQEAIAQAFNGFSLPAAAASKDETADKFLDLCKRSRNLREALAKTDAVFRQMEHSLTKVAELHLEPMQWGPSDEERDIFLRELARERDDLVAQMPQDSRAISEKWEQRIYLAGKLHWALSMCLRIPESEKQNFEERRQLSKEQQDLSAQIAKQVADREKTPSLGVWLDFYWRSFWSFVAPRCFKWVA